MKTQDRIIYLEAHSYQDTYFPIFRKHWINNSNCECYHIRSPFFIRGTYSLIVKTSVEYIKSQKWEKDLEYKLTTPLSFYQSNEYYIVNKL